MSPVYAVHRFVVRALTAAAVSYHLTRFDKISELLVCCVLLQGADLQAGMQASGAYLQQLGGHMQRNGGALNGDMPPPPAFLKLVRCATLNACS